MSDRFDVVRDEMQRQVDKGIRPSIQVAIDWRGELVFDEAIGIDASPESNYTLWSSTKPLIAVALLQVIEEGGARLRDRVHKFIPEFGTHGKQACTIAHLLSHRGGFPDSGQHMTQLARVSRNWDAALEAICEMEAQWGARYRSRLSPDLELVHRGRTRPAAA